MARHGLRFRPPPLVLDDPALRWVLVRAFAAPATPGPGPLPAAALARLARAQGLSLAARVAVRVGRQRLAAEVGAEAAAEFLAASRSAAARALQLEGLRSRVTAIAFDLDLPLVLLKFAALEAAGRLLPGSRSASDLDLLVPPARADQLITALCNAGFEQGDEPEQEHQFPTLFSQGVALELHRHLPGVVVPASGDHFATAEGLAAAQALVPVARGLFRPTDAVLGAHLLAHALAQHGLTPEAYPVLRVFGDLSDLGLGSASDETWREIHRWLPTALSAAEIEAARALLQVLETGDLERIEAAPDAATLLSHLLAGTFDPDYRAALKLRLFAPPLSERGRARAFGAFLKRTLWLSDAQIDAIYGPPRNRPGYHARRWLRPFDLAWRTLRAAAGALRS